MKFLQRFSSLRGACALALLSLSPGLAHATSISYTLTNVSTNKGDLTGTISIDSLTGLVTAADITFQYDAAGDPVFTDIGTPVTYNGLGQDFISGTSNSPLNYGGQLALYYDLSNLGIGDLTICTHGIVCGSEFNQASYAQAYAAHTDQGPIFITGGTLNLYGDDAGGDVAAAPEPPTLVLLGTAILLMAALIARMSGRRTNASLAEEAAE